VAAGLLAPKFYDPTTAFLSFTSSKTASHNTQPDQTTVFSVLEGQPHNLVHNDIGGVGAIDPGPYGNMTNFLSPVDPIFFLHHANIDRLWDVWTRRQISLNQPHLPPEDELRVLSDEPFLFFADFKGDHILNGKAGDYLSTDRFGYEYDRLGFGEELIGPPKPVAQAAAPVAAERVAANAASVRVPAAIMPQRPWQRRSPGHSSRRLRCNGRRSRARSASLSGRPPTQRTSGPTVRSMPERSGSLGRRCPACRCRTKRLLRFLCRRSFPPSPLR